MLVGEVRIAEDRDFETLRTLVDVCDGWNEEYKKSGKFAISVWTKKPGKTSAKKDEGEKRTNEEQDFGGERGEGGAQKSEFKMIKVCASYGDVKPGVLYDVLHDPEYRKHWDTYMLDSYEIGQLNPNNDISYYAVQCPPPMKNRDFVLHRSWLDTEREYLIINHSVFYEGAPLKKGFVRAVSHLTGFVVRPSLNGCTMAYITHSDPKGSLPIWLVNKMTQVFAPKMAKRLHKACLGYEDWKRQNDPQQKPWLYPEQMTAPKIRLDRFLKEDTHRSTESLDDTCVTAAGGVEIDPFGT